MDKSMNRLRALMDELEKKKCSIQEYRDKFAGLERQAREAI